jgi:hypothetical protein
VTLTIQKLATRGRIPLRSGVDRSLVDDVARDFFAVECSRQLNRSWPVQWGVVRIRKLRVQVNLTPLQLKPEALAIAWVAAFKRELFAALAYPTGVGPFETAYFHNRAEYLASLIRDVMAGVAAHRWEYEEFGLALNLDTLESVLVVLDQERSEIIPIFLILKGWRFLDRFLDLAGQSGVERLFMMVQFESGANGDKLSTEDLVVIARFLGSHRSLLDNGHFSTGGYLPGDSSRVRLKLALKIFVAIRHQRDGTNAHGSFSPRSISDALLALDGLLELGQSLQAARRQLDRLRVVLRELLIRSSTDVAQGALVQFRNDPAHASGQGQREFIMVVEMLIPGLTFELGQAGAPELWNYLEMATAGIRTEIAELVEWLMSVATSGVHRQGNQLCDILSTESSAARGDLAQVLEQLSPILGPAAGEPDLVEFGYLLAVARGKDRGEFAEQLIAAIDSDASVAGRAAAELQKLLLAAGSARRVDDAAPLEHSRPAAGSEEDWSELAGLLERFLAAVVGEESWSELAEFLERFRTAANNASWSDLAGLLEQLTLALNHPGVGQPAGELQKVLSAPRGAGREELSDLFAHLRTMAGRAGRSDLAGILGQLMSALSADGGRPGTELQRVLEGADNAGWSDLLVLIERLRTAASASGRSDLAALIEPFLSALRSGTTQSGEAPWKALAPSGSQTISDLAALFEQLNLALGSGASQSETEFQNALGTAGSAGRSPLLLLLGRLRTAAQRAVRSDLTMLAEQLASTLTSGADQPGAEFWKVFAAAGSASRTDFIALLQHDQMAVRGPDRSDLIGLLEKLRSTFSSDVDQAKADLQKILSAASSVATSERAGSLDLLRMAAASAGRSDLLVFLEQLTSAISISGKRFRAPELKIISSDCAGLFFLIRTVAQLQWAVRLNESGFGAAYGPRIVTYTLAGLALAVLNRFEEEPRQIDPGLALFSGWMDEPDLFALRQFFVSGSVEERRDLLSVLLGNEGAEGSSENWTACFDLLATHLIQEFVRRIRGFGRSSRAFILKNFLALPGRIRIEEMRLVVLLAAHPLNVVVHLSGLDDSVPSVSWLKGRRIEFQLDGL